MTALYLARELGISQRSVYRDIETLRSLGAPLDGQAGIGYCLREGFFLPEFAFSSDELDALILGLGWVRQRAGPALAQCSESALAAKIAASDGDIAVTIVVQHAYNTGNALFLASLQAVLPAGQTFTSIQLTYPGNPFGNSSCQVWSVPTSDLSSTTAVSFGSAYDLAATVSTVTISSSAGGFILARAGKRGVTATGVISGDDGVYAERVDFASGGSARLVGADVANTAADASNNVTVTYAASGDQGIMAVAYR